MQKFNLRFPESLIPDLAERYVYQDDSFLRNDIIPKVKSRGFFTKADFRALCVWKTPRIKSKVDRNPEELIQEATKAALASPFDEMRMGTLLLLHGVRYPVASTILHFAHEEPYPILDFRALWSLGIEKQPAYYSLDFWLAYTHCCRSLAEQAGVPMRVLDRALWQYSKENQPKKS